MTYAYDAIGQLVSKDVGSQDIVLYEYDGVGNITSITAGALSVDYVYDDADRLTISSRTLLAGIIFDNGPTDFGAPATSDLGPDNFVSADNFSLQQNASTIGGFQWFGGYAGDSVKPTDDFTIRIYEDSAGNPTLSS